MTVHTKTSALKHLRRGNATPLEGLDPPSPQVPVPGTLLNSVEAAPQLAMEPK